ncbi:MAG TPA: PilN domain-containing protein, partial [Phycisphaerales bacterium]|nr:PilN domain-containing protein [Phycisphaerales bacterium]
RQLLGDSSSSEAWRDSVAQAVDESAELSGLLGTPEAEIARSFTGASGLLLYTRARTHLRSSISGAPADDRWLEQFGLCAAAAAVAFGPSSLRPLAQLTADAPKVQEPTLLRAAGWVAHGARPKTILAASIAILLAGPLAFATVRHGVLKSKASMIDQQKTSREQIDRQAALYSQLETSRWPVTKLLSDISVATPVGINAQTINLSTEMGLKITGVANEPALVNTLQANLNATRLFRNVKVTRTGTIEGGKVEFDMSADVASPHNAVANAENFTEKNLATRLYGEGADNLKEAPVAAKGGSRRTSTTTDSGSSTSNASRRGGDASGPPPALSDADIAKLDLTTARKEWANRKSYLQKNPTLDTASKDRLSAEIPKLQERLEKLRNSGGGA